MPALIISLILIVLCVYFAVFYFKKTEKKINLEKRGINIVIFVLSLISLIISLKLFWNMGVYVDDYGSSPVLVSGGWFWLNMDWLRLGLLFVLCVISGLKLIKRPK
ncbi:hypothetical protein V6C32_02870 [Desulforamulus ruminis]|uniref:Uncharacterized protein n=1 Tax=Desulforamulus ruminis (strain ATCC 23193 / DSM 2154 / NCIMB 8452 / DL) TaxID=696281 RepID=F6DV17_DESRL|nr:hypothetical protein [Desulforamulus ruminis]AEG61414.1 hypothetical protein Desru_3205 [Desulforamulus ruminis DSM 2154]